MNNSSLRIALVYFCISVIWIYSSDMFFEYALAGLPTNLKNIFNILKGIAFVSITAIFLYKLINRHYNKLQRSEEEYRGMFNFNPNPMWIYDPGTLAFMNVNAAAINNYGFSAAEFLSMKVTDIRSPEEAERFKAYIKKKEVVGKSGIWTHILKDGTEIKVEAYAYDIIYNNKKAKLILALDITDMIKYQEQLSEQQQVLEAANAQLKITIKELKISKEKIAVTQKIAKIAGWVYLLEKDLFKFSSRFYELLEIQEKANPFFTFHDVEKFICEEDVSKLRSFMEKFKSGDKEGECVLRVRHHGKWKFIKFGALLVADDHDHRVLEGFVQDITRIELKDQLIKTTIERFEQLATATSDTIYDWDYKNDMIRWSGNVSYLMDNAETENFHKEEWWLERIHPEDLQKNHNLLIKAIEKREESLKREYRFRVESGEYKLLFDQSTIKYDDQNNVDKIIGSLHDIEEITRINKENKRLGKVVNKVKNLILITDEEGYIEWANAAFFERTGFNWKQVKGTKPWELLKYPSTSEDVVMYMRQAMKKVEFFNVEVENIMKDGSSRWFHIEGSPIKDEENNFGGYIAIESDITERKVREEKINRQNELLKESAWINSHQVRKPLASILGLIQLMQLADNEEETVEYLSLLEICSKELDENIKRSVALVENKE